MITHTDNCVHPPIYDGGDCESIDGWPAWNQPQGSYVEEAKDELGDDAPWCAVRQRAWELQQGTE